MPVLNDVTHVRAAVDSILRQDYTGPFEITIAVGPSIDGTMELVEDLAATDERIRVIENTVGSTPAGLNLAIRESVHPIVIRVDAHSVLPPHYTTVAVETMKRTDADNVGGIMDAQGETSFERAVARAYSTKVGLGGTRLHVGGPEGPAETVYLGVFKRSTLTRVGLFDEDIKRGQDWELNHRIRASGGTIWFTPRLSVTYRPRSTLGRLARQMLSTGLWRGELVRRNPGANGIRYFIPPVTVLATTLGILAGIVGVVQAIVGVPPWLLWGLSIPAAYLVFVVIATLIYARSEAATAARFLVVLPCIHVCWGIGFVLGFFALARNISAHTGR